MAASCPRPSGSGTAALGPGFVVVAQADAAQDEAATRALAGAGVRGLCCSLSRGRWSDPHAAATHHAGRAASCGLHAQLYAGAGLPVVLDLRAGVTVKASGFGRVSRDVPRLLERIAAIAPAALMFGTDLPSIRAARPFMPSDIDLLRGVLGEGLARSALHDSARALYRLWPA